MSPLFESLAVGNVKLNHRIALAPLTRFRADKHHNPGDLQVEYYRQRASVPGTLLITEGTLPTAYAGGVANVPGIWSAAQIEGWKRVTTAVHGNKSHIYLQVWAAGRAATAALLEADGVSSGVVAPSAIPIAAGSITPRALSEAEIQQYVTDFAVAAENAIAAGFDGVEIHALNGYLLDSFIQTNSNARTDRYGGSIENRARFPLEVVRAVVDAIGAKRTAVRFSPWSEFQGMRMPDPIPQFSYLLEQVRPLGLSYLSIVEPRFNGAVDATIGPQNENDSNAFALRIWGRASPIIVSGGFSPKMALEMAHKHADLDIIVAFGRHFLSNPDLPFRIMRELPLNKHDRDTFYAVEQARGYTDYPFSDEWKHLVDHDGDPVENMESSALDQVEVRQ